MSDLYGRVRGSAKTEATRQGSKSSGIRTSAETWASKTVVELEADGSVLVYVSKKQGGGRKVLFEGNADSIAERLT